MRYLLIAALFVTAGAVTSLRADPVSKNDSLQLLLERIDQLEARVKALESRPLPSTCVLPAPQLTPSTTPTPRGEAVPFNGSHYYILPVSSQRQLDP
ncbi:MAG: hypothetical protein KDA81_13925 [Planctomycetaceae bacterium]|nr:hypothetical protein [Planctomycetaceae bacterium]